MANKESNYIMKEQVRNLIPSIMEYDVTRERDDTSAHFHLKAIAAVTTIYLLAMALSG
jgi:hypothetical protein